MTVSEGRKFGLTVGLAFSGLAALLWWRQHLLASMVAAALGGSLIAAGVMIPSHLGPVHSAWMKLAWLISKITTPIFMGVVYFLVLTPFGLLARPLRSNPLVRRKTSTGFWVTRETPRSDSMERQF